MGERQYFRILDKKTGLFAIGRDWNHIPWGTSPSDPVYWKNEDQSDAFRSITQVKRFLRLWKTRITEIPESWVVVERRIYEGRKTPARHVLKPPPPPPCERCAIGRDYYCVRCKLLACKGCARFHKCPGKPVERAPVLLTRTRM